MWTRYEVIQFCCLAVVTLTGLLMLSTLFSTSDSGRAKQVRPNLAAVERIDENALRPSRR